MTRFRGVIEFALFVASISSSVEDEIHFLFDFPKYSTIRDDFSAKHMGILFAHARDEWNILSSTPLLVFERAPVGFQTGDLRCDKDLVKRDERL